MPTAISWAEETWNPLTGCTRVSEGCRNCYAERASARMATNPGTEKYRGIAEFTEAGPRWSGAVEYHLNLLDLPLRWRKPRRVFVCSMSDLFHEGVRDEWLLDIFDVFRRCLNTRSHVFQVLTKRPERARDFCSRLRFGSERGTHLVAGYEGPGYRLMGGAGCSGLTNVWLGTSVEDQATADDRIPLLLATPAAKRFISYEPALRPLDLSKWMGSVSGTQHVRGYAEDVDAEWSELDWVVAGGESGPGRREAKVAWFESLAQQCSGAGVPFFMKQDSGNRPGQQGRIPDGLWAIKEYPK